MFIIMETQYIYLLLEREFIKTNELIYKLGKTKQKNTDRFKSYPKGSILLYLTLCDNCDLIEKQLINIFKIKYKQRKDIGTEYFEGNYKDMVDTINQYLKEFTTNNIKLDSDSDSDNEESDEELSKYEINTYEDFMKFTNIYKIIITNKKRREGYLKFWNHEWRQLHQYNNDDQETLSEFIENNSDDTSAVIVLNPVKNEVMPYVSMFEKYRIYTHNNTKKVITYNDFMNLVNEEKNNYITSTKCIYKGVEVIYNYDKIINDICNKCYCPNPVFYKLQYHEYLVNTSKENKIVAKIYNSINRTFTEINEYDKLGIIVSTHCTGRLLYINDDISISIVQNILNSLITKPVILKNFKKLCYNMFVKQSNETFIFYDNYTQNPLLSTWLKDLHYTLLGYSLPTISTQNDIDELIEKIKMKTPRCVILNYYDKKTINIMNKLNIYNIIIKTNCGITFYNYDKYESYLNNYKDIIDSHIGDKTSNHNKMHSDSIFYNTNLLFTNFLIWCTSFT
jgi:hypothetical protein